MQVGAPRQNGVVDVLNAGELAHPAVDPVGDAEQGDHVAAVGVEPQGTGRAGTGA